MPELPEVQTVVNDLKKLDLGSFTLKKAHLYWPRTLNSANLDSLNRILPKLRFVDVQRRAKYIHLVLGQWHLIIHLRMSGRLHWLKSTEKRSKHEHFILRFTEGYDLRFHDPRKFGRVTFTQDPQAIFASLGPEPLNDQFSVQNLIEIFKYKQRALKPALLDQTNIAGLGNIYVDEALWEAKLHPMTVCSTLSNNQFKKLHESIRSVLQKGIKNLGTSLGNSKINFYSVAGKRGENAEKLNVYRQTGNPCLRCNSSIVRERLFQRSTHFCPKCQVINYL